MTRDIPIGKGLNVALEKKIDMGAPIKSEMYQLYLTLKEKGLLEMVDRGGLEGFAGLVRTFDLTLTARGREVLGEVRQGKPDYSTWPSAYGIPDTYLTVGICRKKVKEVTGIRIIKPDVGAGDSRDPYSPVTCFSFSPRSGRPLRSPAPRLEGATRMPADRSWRPAGQSCGLRRIAGFTEKRSPRGAFILASALLARGWVKPTGRPAPRLSEGRSRNEPSSF